MRTTLSVQQIIDEFILNRDVCELSKIQYHNALERFFRWCNANDIDIYNVQFNHINQYKNSSNVAIATINLWLTVIKSFYKYCENKKYCDNPTVGIRFLSKSKTFKKYPLSLDNIHQLMGVLSSESIQGKRDKAIILLMLVNGLRLVEISRMNMDDLYLNDDGKYCIMIQGKGHISKDTEIYIEQEVMDAITAYLVVRRETQPGDPLFSSHAFMHNNARMIPNYLSQLISQHLIKAGIKSKRISPHSLRHTCAVMMINNDAKLYDVQVRLRHTSPLTTQIYTRTIEEEMNKKTTHGKMIIRQILSVKNTADNQVKKQ